MRIRSEDGYDPRTAAVGPCVVCEDETPCTCPKYRGEEPFECRTCGALSGQHLAQSLQCPPRWLDVEDV